MAIIFILIEGSVDNPLLLEVLHGVQIKEECGAAADQEEKPEVKDEKPTVEDNKQVASNQPLQVAGERSFHYYLKGIMY